ncbi:hypothetical protein Fmac_019742 [Flemingia macrophylla]|uniref:Uncharacterized protein n=1 Tax=Flemingia macrophylla TaxID=520843 RepID=A0ABD1M8T4_9FABA
MVSEIFLSLSRLNILNVKFKRLNTCRRPIQRPINTWGGPLEAHQVTLHFQKWDPENAA